MNIKEMFEQLPVEKQALIESIKDDAIRNKIIVEFYNDLKMAGNISQPKTNYLTKIIGKKTGTIVCHAPQDKLRLLVDNRDAEKVKPYIASFSEEEKDIKRIDGNGGEYTVKEQYKYCEFTQEFHELLKKAVDTAITELLKDGE